MIQSSASSSLQSRLHKHEQFASRLIDEKHDFIVYVPQVFNDDPNRFFPVLYLHDGQNLFDPETSFIKGNYWRVGETADALIESGEVEPLVIVGIYNTGVKRVDEYTPVEDRRLGGGGADAYGQMLVEELQAFRGPPLPYAGGRGELRHGRFLAGRAGDACISACAIPTSSANLAILSPSVWWHNRVILRTVEQIRRSTGQRIWLDMGTREGRRALADVRALKRLLIKKGWETGCRPRVPRNRGRQAQ